MQEVSESLDSALSSQADPRRKGSSAEPLVLEWRGRRGCTEPLSAKTPWKQHHRVIISSCIYLFIPTISGFQFFWQLSSLRIFLDLFFIVLDSLIDV